MMKNENITDFPFKVRENIENSGLSVLGTIFVGDGFKTHMTYSIGITETLGKPEVILFGIRHEEAQQLINMYYDFLKRGIDLVPGVEYSDFFYEDYPTKFSVISRESYVDYLKVAYDFNITNNNRIEAVQMLYPDIDGNWPEHSKDENYLKCVNALK